MMICFLFPSWFYNLFDKTISGAIRNALNKQVCDLATTNINTQGSKALESLPSEFREFKCMVKENIVIEFREFKSMVKENIVIDNIMMDFAFNCSLKTYVLSVYLATNCLRNTIEYHRQNELGWHLLQQNPMT